MRGGLYQKAGKGIQEGARDIVAFVEAVSGGEGSADRARDADPSDSHRAPVADADTARTFLNDS
jgi:predicted lipid-binding transport protein (Tim44 family)